MKKELFFYNDLLINQIFEKKISIKTLPVKYLIRQYILYTKNKKIVIIDTFSTFFIFKLEKKKKVLKKKKYLKKKNLLTFINRKKNKFLKTILHYSQLFFIKLKNQPVLNKAKFLDYNEKLSIFKKNKKVYFILINLIPWIIYFHKKKKQSIFFLWLHLVYSFFLKFATTQKNAVLFMYLKKFYFLKKKIIKATSKKKKGNYLILNPQFFCFRKYQLLSFTYFSKNLSFKKQLTLSNYLFKLRWLKNNKKIGFQRKKTFKKGFSVWYFNGVFISSPRLTRFQQRMRKQLKKKLKRKLAENKKISKKTKKKIKLLYPIGIPFQKPIKLRLKKKYLKIMSKAKFFVKKNPIQKVYSRINPFWIKKRKFIKNKNSYFFKKRIFILQNKPIKLYDRWANLIKRLKKKKTQQNLKKVQQKKIKQKVIKNKKQKIKNIIKPKK